MRGVILLLGGMAALLAVPVLGIPNIYILAPLLVMFVGFTALANEMQRK